MIRPGASVVLADWNEQAVRTAAGELADKGYKTLGIGCDVADDAQVEAIVTPASAVLPSSVICTAFAPAIRRVL